MSEKIILILFISGIVCLLVCAVYYGIILIGILLVADLWAALTGFIGVLLIAIALYIIAMIS